MTSCFTIATKLKVLYGNGCVLYEVHIQKMRMKNEKLCPDPVYYSGQLIFFFRGPLLEMNGQKRCLMRFLNSVWLLLVFISSHVEAGTEEEERDHLFIIYPQNTVDSSFWKVEAFIWDWGDICKKLWNLKNDFSRFSIKHEGVFPPCDREKCKSSPPFYPLIDTHPLVNPLHCLHNCSWKSLKCESDFTLHTVGFSSSEKNL